MTKSNKPCAIAYCRVSSVKQVVEGTGLESQETRCIEYAKYKKLDVIKTFKDEGVSGGLIERPGMQDMLAYLKKHSKQQSITVIIDDISRLARGLDAHIQLRNAISSAGGKLESPSIEFGEDSDSILVENLLASVSQHARQKNAEQVVNRQRARTLNGYWCFYPPLGYKFKAVKGHGKLMMRQEPVASIIAEGLEGFASGRFETASEVRFFYESQPAYPKGGNGKVHLQRVLDHFECVIYAGFLEVRKWGISLQPAKHKPLISFETWQKIQARLNQKAKAPARMDISEDFPLRGFVSCGCCDHPMTAAWTQGRSAKYPYYFCQNKSCVRGGKSVRKEKLEEEFEKLLKSLVPNNDLFKISHEMLSDLWQHQRETIGDQVKASKEKLEKIDGKSAKLVDKIVEADNQTLVKAYEAKIKKLDENRIALTEKIEKCGRPLASFEKTYRTAMQFLSNPWKLWDSDNIIDKRLVLRLAFSDHLKYTPEQGYRTAKTTLPFKVLEHISEGSSGVVRAAGLEPARSFPIEGF